MKYKIILIMAWLVISINYLPLYAAWWNEEVLPLPPEAKEVEEEAAFIANSEFAFKYYASPQDAVSIRNFYLKQLSVLGWKEKEILKNNLVFEKGRELLIINFMSQGHRLNDGKTYFMLSKGKIDLEEPKEEAGIKEQPIPVYPGGSLLEPKQQKQASGDIYTTPDSIDQVLSFYKLKMPGYGWSLIDEEAIKKEENISSSGINCPSCPKNLDVEGLIKSIEMYRAKLVFSHQKGDICRINLDNMKASKEELASLNKTTIMVGYEKKR